MASGAELLDPAGQLASHGQRGSSAAGTRAALVHVELLGAELARQCPRLKLAMVAAQSAAQPAAQPAAQLAAQPAAQPAAPLRESAGTVRRPSPSW